jgi:hypothetical protein
MTTPPAPPAAPQKSSSGNRTLFIVLGIILFLMLIMGGCAVACTYFLKSAAEDFSEHPELSAIKFAVKFSPDIEVADEDVDAGIITLRNKKTGEEVTIDINNYNPDTIGNAITDVMTELEEVDLADTESNYGESDSYESNDDGDAEEEEAPTPARAAAVAANVDRLPDFVSPYPDSTTKDASFHKFGTQAMGAYTFSSTDTAEEIVAFYEEKLAEKGFTTVMSGFEPTDNGSSANFMATAPDGAAAFVLEAIPEDDGSVTVTISATSTEN